MMKLSEIVGRGYDDFWNTKCFYRMCKGSKGSKKSKTAALWYIYHMMRYPEANTLVIRKVFTSLKDSCYTDLLWAIDRLGVTSLWKSSVSPLQITYIPTGQVILFRGLDDALKLASITVRHGYLCWVWFEEFFEITDEAAFEKVAMSIRGYLPPETGLYKQITGTFNPWSEHTWIKKRFYDQKADNIFATTTTYKDNEFLGEDDIVRYEQLREYNPRAARIICDGDWGIAEGLIYDNWREEDFDFREVASKPGIKYTFGLDFGYKLSPNAFVAILVDLRGHKMWICDEMYKTGMSNIDIARELDLMGYGKERIIADCAEPKSIFELKAGLLDEVEAEDGTMINQLWQLPNIQPAMKGNDSIMNGIQRIQSFEIIVHPKCVNFLMELNNYAYDKDKDGNYLNKPIDDFNHLMDAMRYAMEKFFSRARGLVAEAKGKDGAVHHHVSKRVVSTY